MTATEPITALLARMSAGGWKGGSARPLLALSTCPRPRLTEQEVLLDHDEDDREAAERREHGHIDAPERDQRDDDVRDEDEGERGDLARRRKVEGGEVDEPRALHGLCGGARKR